MLPTSRKVIALTFDAGANADGVASILATLADRGVPGTFFLTGAWCRAYPTQAKRIAGAYPVGNHTDTHADLTKLGAAAVATQIQRAETAIIDATGHSPVPLFRFPMGARDATAIARVNAAGYVAFRWTVDTLGWKGTAGGISADVVRSRVLDAARPGAIVLMHVGSNPDDGTTFDADALPSTIDALRAQGYGFVTLRDVIG